MMDNQKSKSSKNPGFKVGHGRGMHSLPAKVVHHDNSPMTFKQCTIPDCNKKYYAKGYCHSHYQVLLMFTPKIGRRKKCKIAGCLFTSIRYDTCTLHRRLLKERKGAPTGPRNFRWNGGTSQYKNHYAMKQARKKKFEQSNGKCEECGLEAQVIHHLDRSKDNHALENLKALCNVCHINKYHTKYNLPPISLANMRVGDTILIPCNNEDKGRTRSRILAAAHRYYGIFGTHAVENGIECFRIE